jgi:hypothetical protein
MIKLSFKEVGVGGINDGGELNGDEKPSATSLGVNTYGLRYCPIDSRVDKVGCLSVEVALALVNERVIGREQGVEQKFGGRL